MEILLTLLIKVLTLQVAVLGCAPDCTAEQKADFTRQAIAIQQDLNAIPSTTTAPQQTVDTPQVQQPAPVVEQPAPVVQQEAPLPDPKFVGTPSYTMTEQPGGNVLLTYSWQTTSPVAATFSLCLQQWTCVSQGSTTGGTFQIERPRSGVEWIEIRVSDTEFYRAQRPQL